MRMDLIPIDKEGRIARIIEEMGEALKAYGKMKRFGEIATDPITNITYHNLLDFNNEINDLLHAIKEYKRYD